MELLPDSSMKITSQTRAVRISTELSTISQQLFYKADADTLLLPILKGLSDSAVSHATHHQ
jgi:hypothetical protein